MILLTFEHRRLQEPRYILDQSSRSRQIWRSGGAYTSRDAPTTAPGAGVRCLCWSKIMMTTINETRMTTNPTEEIVIAGWDQTPQWTYCEVYLEIAGYSAEIRIVWIQRKGYNALGVEIEKVKCSEKINHRDNFVVVYICRPVFVIEARPSDCICGRDKAFEPWFLRGTKSSVCGLSHEIRERASILSYAQKPSSAMNIAEVPLSLSLSLSADLALGILI